MTRLLMIKLAAIKLTAITCLGLAFLLTFNGCGDDDVSLGVDEAVDFVDDTVESVEESFDDDDTDDSIDDGGSVAGGGSVIDGGGGNIPISGNSTEFFIPDNCDNPPTQLSANDGFQCIASRTRNDSIVCLLPFQFTWNPLVPFTDDAGFTFGCNANDDFFDEVRIRLTNGQEIRLEEAGCFNFVSTADGQIGRQHWRNEGVQFGSVASQLSLMIMTRDGQDTCLRF